MPLPLMSSPRLPSLLIWLLGPVTGVASAMSGGTLGQEGDDEARTGQSVGARVLFDYDNAFSLKTPNRAWRLIGEDDARKMAPDACAGLRGTGRVRGVQLLTIVEHPILDVANATT